MIKKLIELIKDLVFKIDDFNPSIFNDPIAEQTGWHPVKSGGTNFRTHRLFKKSDWLIQFKPTIAAIISSGFFLGMGLAITGILFLFDIKENWFILLLIFLVGLIFFGIGGRLIYTYSSPITFDKECGAFWKGRGSPMQIGASANIKECVWLSNIHALQIIPEYCGNNDNDRGYSYRSYELNLVMKDAKRINVIDHGNYARLRQDAETLAEFLNVPLWDSI